MFVSGKHYYTLVGEREARGIKDTAIIRIESLCPFPTQEINAELEKYKQAKSMFIPILCHIYICLKFSAVLISSVCVMLILLIPEFVWSQEEHRNMGAWFFVHPRFENLCSTKVSFIVSFFHSCILYIM